MKQPKVWWDEEERFARHAAAVFTWFIIIPVVMLAGVGLATQDPTLLLGAFVIVAIGVGSVVLWVVAAIPIMLLFIGAISMLRWLQQLRSRRAV